MNKKYFLILLTWVFLISWPVFLANADPCDHLEKKNQIKGAIITNAEMVECAYWKKDQAEKVMDKTLNQVLKKFKNDKARVANIQAAQNTWLEFRDLHLKSAFPVPEGSNAQIEFGTMYPIVSSDLLEQMTEQRTSQLKQLLIDLYE